MNPYSPASFSSFSDFTKRFADMLKGPGFISAFRKTDDKCGLSELMLFDSN